MTKSRRNRIYRMAYESVSLPRREFLCIAIVDAYNSLTGQDALSMPDIVGEFPEFVLMAPDVLLDIPPYSNLWYEPSDKTSRLTALAFCMAMTD